MTRRERDLQRLARARGWTLERTSGRSGHYRLVHPSGAMVVASWTPSDRRNLTIVRATMQRLERGQAQ